MMAMRIEQVKIAHLNGRFCFLTGNDHIARPQIATKQMPKMMMMALSFGSRNLEPINLEPGTISFSVQTDWELWLPPSLLPLLLLPPPLLPPPLGAIALGLLFLQISKLSRWRRECMGREKWRKKGGAERLVWRWAIVLVLASLQAAVDWFFKWVGD